VLPPIPFGGFFIYKKLAKAVKRFQRFSKVLKPSKRLKAPLPLPPYFVFATHKSVLKMEKFFSLQTVVSVIAAIVILYFLMQWFGPKPVTTTVTTPAA